MQRGTVKWFDDTKGYGYIKQDDGLEVFVHFTDIEQDGGFRYLTKDEVVTYEIVDGELGAKAINVRRVKKV
jgi:CspA family cold shock protein